MSTTKSTKKPQPVVEDPITSGALPDFSPSLKGQILAAFETLNEKFTGKVNFELTDVQRRRLISSGIRNYGFLDKTSDLAGQHQDLLPPKFEVDVFKVLIRNLEFIRDLLSLIRGLDRAVSNAMFVYGDEVFRMALRFYHSVRELARTGDPDAVAVFNMLKPYFARGRRKGSDSPTESEVERDVRALLKGSKDGKILIENERPRMTKGKRVVVDETQRDRGAWKETEKGEIN